MRVKGSFDTDGAPPGTWTARPGALVFAATCFTLAAMLFVTRDPVPIPEASAQPAPAVGAAPAAASTGAAVEPARVLPADVIEVGMTEFSYEPLELTLPTGSYTFRVANRGRVPHEFALSTAGHHGTHFVETGDVLPGTTVEVEAELDPGRYEFACHLPGHYEAGMAGTITVTD